MEKEIFEHAMDLANQVRHFLVATADVHGHPHIASVGSLTPASPTDIVLSEWFCPGTVANIQQNPYIAVVIWDSDRDIGYQLIGTVTSIQDLAVLNGYVPGEEEAPPLPQAEEALRVHVDRILGFSHAPHADTELETCVFPDEERRQS